MSSAPHVLLVDDDEIFREIAADTLQSNGYTVTQKENGKVALDGLSAYPPLTAVISDIRMPEMDGIEFLKKWRTVSKVPVILTTGFSDALEVQSAEQLGAAGFIAKPFGVEEILEILRRAEQGGSGEKEGLSDEDFARVALDDFISGKVLRYNIYVRLSANKYVKIANQGVDLDVNRIQAYKQKGARYLFLKKTDFREYLTTSLSLAKKLKTNSGIDNTKRERFLRHTGALLVEKAMVDGVDAMAVLGAKEFLNVSLEIISTQEDLFTMLDLLNEHSDFLYAHSIGVSLYSVMIAQAMGWRANPTVFRVGLAGLLHDIGLKEIDQKIISKPRAQMQRADRILYETHPIRSSEILATCDLVPEEVRQAVEQHHEEVSGVGYPRGSRGKDLTPLGRLLNVADIFCEFAIKNPDYPRGMSAGEAVDRMEQLKGDVLDPEFFGALKKIVVKA